MCPIRVIGLGGRASTDDWEHLLEGRKVAVRNTEAARRSTPPGCTFHLSFDTVVDSTVIGRIAQTIVDELLSLNETDSVAYLVPGVAAFGDITVERLASRVSVELVSGTYPELGTAGAGVRIVDALELAEAEASRPFASGMTPLDPRVRTLVTNLSGRNVVKYARQCLSRTYAGYDTYVRKSIHDAVYLEARQLDDPGPSVSALLEIVARLRRPDGCPWDREQTPESLIVDFKEEVEEVCSAIERRDWDNLAEELGDVLLHLCMQAQIAAESDRFSFDDVVTGISAKLIRRHPHVFGNESAASPEEVLSVWLRVKQEEKAAQRDVGS